jgi:hypothetical protein
MDGRPVRPCPKMYVVDVPHAEAAERSEERIGEVERDRAIQLRLMRLLSLTVSILVLVSTALQTTNDFFNYVPTPWMLSLPCMIVGVLEVVVEYAVRRRVPLVEGRSEHLLFVQQKIRELEGILGRYEALRKEPGFVPEVATDEEMTRLWAALHRHMDRLNFDESTAVVLVPAPSGDYLRPLPHGTAGS